MEYGMNFQKDEGTDREQQVCRAGPRVITAPSLHRLESNEVRDNGPGWNDMSQDQGYIYPEARTRRIRVALFSRTNVSVPPKHMKRTGNSSSYYGL